jgi:hypothetical protein
MSLLSAAVVEGVLGDIDVTVDFFIMVPAAVTSGLCGTATFIDNVEGDNQTLRWSYWWIIQFSSRLSNTSELRRLL